MFGQELKPLMDAAQKMLRDTISDQVDQARLEIAAQQRKIKRLNMQAALLSKVFKKLAEPPPTFKPAKLTKAQRKRLEKVRQQMIPTAAFAPMVGR